jgi:hypothetical protein
LTITVMWVWQPVDQPVVPIRPTSHERALLYFSPHHPTTQQTLGIRSMFAMARVATPTVEAERNVNSSPVCEAVSEVRPPGGGFCVPGIVPWARRVTDEPQREKDQRHFVDT